ncbi:hypothetical protein Pla111_12410 [Botrimarina hoheduenensis]|uniref:Uncharacterized protein n=1 Tax=Botrimarina hoheduenensis TaxID=2528000 RepID=A0A5C5WBZ2_9BACT|nr:hypothetical protein Pla111_12410 [Botrimarina hoheduenensis]
MRGDSSPFSAELVNRFTSESPGRRGDFVNSVTNPSGVLLRSAEKPVQER